MSQLYSAVKSAAAFSVLSLVLIVAGCRHTDENVSAAHTLPVASVAVATRTSLINTLEVAGEFVPLQEVELHAKVAGYIRRINVDIGDRVHAGEVLATLDIPELNAQVQGAEAGVRQTQEQIGRARNEALRAQADYDAVHSAAQRLQQVSRERPGLIAQQELDDAVAKDRAAAAQVEAAKSAQSATLEQLDVSRADRQRVAAMADYSRIVAPFNGIVTWRYADTGSLIQAGTSNAASAPVVKIAQVDTLRLRLPVPESLAGFVRVGDPASVRVQALGETFTGTITRSTGALDPATRTMQVEIDVPNRDGRLSPGMYAEVSLAIQRAADAVAVPVQAVDQSTGKPFVMRVDADNTVEQRAVRIGITTPDRVEILSGVNPGDRVIVANLATFQPGEEVTPKESSAGLKSSGEVR